MRNNPTQIIVHHTAVSSPRAQLRGVDDYHRDREFPLSSLGWYVGYHYLIERDGSVTKCREESEEGAHTKGQNFSSVGICLSGNLDIELPTEAQRASLGTLLVEIARRYRIPATRIFPHRRYAEKSCYGSLLSDKWAAWEYVYAELTLIARALAALRLTTNL